MVVSNPIVDVLMTVFNGEAHVELAIDSIRNQTLTNILIHVVNDGSTDTTSKILNHLMNLDNRIKIYNKENEGVVKSSNLGLGYCNSDFIARMDADDVAYPDRLERQVRLLEDDPKRLAVSGNAHQIDVRGDRLAGKGAIFTSPKLADVRYIPAREPYLLHPFLLVRRSALVQVGGYRDLTVSEDSDLYWRLSELGDLYNDDYFYGSYRMNPSSLSSRSIRHGRVMAAYSQIAALSALRRREGRADISFTPEYAAAIQSSSHSLSEIFQTACTQLQTSESNWLKKAMSAKLLELSGYRPYELEMSDCLFIGSVYDDVSSLPRDNKTSLLKMYNGIAARLARAEKWDLAKALLNNNIGAAFWSRYWVRKLSGSIKK